MKKDFYERMRGMNLFKEEKSEEILYHVSASRIVGNKLWQRIPKDRAEGENKTIERICFGKTFEGCITAMPNGVKLAENLSLCEIQMGLPAILHIYSIKKSDIQEGNVRDSEFLIKNKLVPDADVTGEEWVINQDVVCNHSVIRLKYIDKEIIPCDWKENNIVVKVKHVEFEKSIEPYERKFTYKFHSAEDMDRIKRYALKSGCEIFREQQKDNNRYYLGIKVPSGIDAQGLWEKVDSLIWRRLGEYYKKETGKRKFLSKGKVLCHLNMKDKKD